MIVWVIGLSGAGKSAIGAALHREMKKDNPATVLIDGRHIPCKLRRVEMRGPRVT